MIVNERMGPGEKKTSTAGKIIFILRAFLLVTSFSILACLDSLGQLPASKDVTATAKLDTGTIKIGQQTHLTIELSHPRSLKVDWITVPDTISKIEIVDRSGVDTVPSKDSSLLTRKQVFTITCFDSGYYAIPPFTFSYKNPNDTSVYTAETGAMLFSVNTVPVDTTKAIRDIKAPAEVALSWRDFLPYIIGVIVLAFITWLVWYLIRQSKKPKPVLQPWIPPRPAHEIAMEELKKLSEEKLWQQGNIKAYHTRLTDIIRVYIAYRWQVIAPEMTTDEILSNKEIQLLGNENTALLRRMLVLADLVKFAKAQPVADENEQGMADAFEFVNRTRPVAPNMLNEKKEVVS